MHICYNVLNQCNIHVVGMHRQNSDHDMSSSSRSQKVPALKFANISQLGDVILKAAARLNLPINWIPGRLSEQNFDLEEPPTKSSPWVGVLLNNVRVFHQRLETLGAINQHDINQVQEMSPCMQARGSSRPL